MLQYGWLISKRRENTEYSIEYDKHRNKYSRTRTIHFALQVAGK